MRIDKSTTEAIAVTEVQRLVNRCPLLSEDIKKRDKNMLEDGPIDVFNSPKKVPANWVGTFRVQVKGTTTKFKKKRGYAAYDVPIEHMKKYADLFGGIMFFLVTVGKNLNPKQVYYEKLLPKDIDEYLRKARGKVTVRIKLKPFPTSPREVSRIASAFVEDKRKQAVAKVAHYGPLDEDGNLRDGISLFSISKQLYVDESFANVDAFRDRTYVYAKDESGQLLVLDSIEDVSMVSLGTTATVSSGNYSVRTVVFAGETRGNPKGKKGWHLEVEGLELDILKKKTSISWHVHGNFRRRLRTVSLAHEFLQTGTLVIDGQPVVRVKSCATDGPEMIKLRDGRNVYERIMRTLDMLGIQEDWDPSEFTQRDADNLEVLCKAFADGVPLSQPKNDSVIAHLDIQGTRIFVAVVKRDDGKVDLLNLFSENLPYAFGWPRDEEAGDGTIIDPVPPMMLLTKESFGMLANADPNAFVAALERFPVTEGNWEALNSQLLMMLVAYDEGAKRPNELLACCAVLAKALYEFDMASSTALINVMQTMRRRRSLTMDEERTLRELIASDVTDKYKAAACAILGDVAQAEVFKEHCSPREKDMLEDWPISAFFRVRT